jgi:hypothetical protein
VFIQTNYNDTVDIPQLGIKEPSGFISGNCFLKTGITRPFLPASFFFTARNFYISVTSTSVHIEGGHFPFNICHYITHRHERRKSASVSLDRSSTSISCRFRLSQASGGVWEERRSTQAFLALSITWFTHGIRQTAYFMSGNTKMTRKIIQSVSSSVKNACCKTQ